MNAKPIDRVSVSVTDEHISKGRIAKCRECPIALAVRDALDRDDVRVSFCFARVGDETYTLPGAVRRFIDRFDNEGPRGKFRPFTFTMVRTR